MGVGDGKELVTVDMVLVVVVVALAVFVGFVSEVAVVVGCRV